jgi:hypothetical protein
MAGDDWESPSWSGSRSATGAPVDVFPRSPSLLLLQEARRLEELRMAAIEERRPYMKVFKGSRCISAKAAELQERWSGLLPGLL